MRLLKDGTPVTIRAIRKDDKKRILDAFRALDREAVYRRFFSPKEDLTGAELEQVTDVDFRKVERLEETLNADASITSAAAPILRNLIDAIILHPREKKGRMSIEVYGEPSVLLLPGDGELADEKNRMITVVAEEGRRRDSNPRHADYDSAALTS